MKIELCLEVRENKTKEARMNNNNSLTVRPSINMIKADEGEITSDRVILPKINNAFSPNSSKVNFLGKSKIDENTLRSKIRVGILEIFLSL